jgi:hypothetical protein
MASANYGVRSKDQRERLGVVSTIRRGILMPHRMAKTSLHDKSILQAKNWPH